MLAIIESRAITRVTIGQRGWADWLADTLGPAVSARADERVSGPELSPTVTHLLLELLPMPMTIDLLTRIFAIVHVKPWLGR